MTISATPPRRWDPLIKITHWGIVGTVIGNALLVGEGSTAHIYVGYALAALLGVRLLWGLIGPASARFASFPPSPRRAMAHVRDILARRKEEHISHNPLGALMAYAVWVCLAVIVASGIAMAGPPPAIDRQMTAAQLVSAGDHEGEDRYEEEHEGEGESGETGELFEEVHEVAVNILYVLIALHLAGVAFETVRSGRRTVTAMLPGGE